MNDKSNASTILPGMKVSFSDFGTPESRQGVVDRVDVRDPVPVAWVSPLDGSPPKMLFLSALKIVAASRPYNSPPGMTPQQTS